MNREATELWSAALGAAGTVIRYGHWGRPVLVFPSERGRAWDFENNGMIGAVQDLIDAGRVKLYCVDSYDAASWSNHEIPLEERARRHGRYESWIVGDVVPWIYRRRRRPRRRDHRSAAAWAPSTRPTSPSSGPTCSRWRCASPATTTPPRGTAGASAATRRTSTTRWTTSATCPVTTWTGCAASCQPAAGLRAGPVGGHHRRAGEHPAVRRAARRARDQARNRSLGV